MRKLKHISLQLIAFSLLMGMAISSCTETELVPYDRQPTNRITEYKVTNATEVLYGVVDDIDNTITVSLPFYLSINFIVPEIKLEEGATLIDGQGNPIDIREDLDPVPFDSVGYTYRIKDAANAIREYKLVTKILPHKDPLKMGFGITYGGVRPVVNDTVTKESIINARIYMYGNLESSSMNAKLTLVNQQTKAVIPNGLKLYSITSGANFYTVLADISPNVNAGDYNIIMEHQGRTDTLPTIHLKHKRPYFGQLPKVMTHGDTITLAVSGPNTNGEVYSGTNTGVSHAYLVLDEALLFTRPADFPSELSKKRIELEIISQNRTEIKFRFPDNIPVGLYMSNQGIGSGIRDGYFITQTGFGIYFDFEDSPWGENNLLATSPYLNFEVKAKQ